MEPMPEILRYTAFSADPAGGNPAGVVLDADTLTDDRKQQIAAEVGYSETAFACLSGPRRLNVRFFSPLAEVAFCGHATIATAVAIAEREGTGELTFSTPAGQIDVVTERAADGLRASLQSVPTHTRPAAPDDVARALAALHWSGADLATGFPAHVSYAGNDHLVLAVRSRERLAKLDYDFETLKQLMAEHGWTTLQLFWRQDEYVVHSRNPFPVGGVVEDPATGAAAAALGGYLRDLGYLAAPASITVIQGEDMGRRSELEVNIEPDTPRVTVTGTATEIPV